MKRKIIGVLAAALLLTVLAVPAAATDTEVTASGFNTIQAVANVTVTPLKTDQSPVSQVSANISKATPAAYVDFYPDSARLTVTLKSTTEGKQYGLFLVKGTALPTASNASEVLDYIDQKPAPAGGGALSFDVYPKDLPTTGTANTRMTLFITVSGDTAGTEGYTVSLYFAPNATYQLQPYLLGDVNNIGGVTALDASLVLQYVVAEGQAAKDVIIPPEYQIRADVNKQGGITALDASVILQYVAADPEDKPNIIPGN